MDEQTQDQLKYVGSKLDRLYASSVSQTDVRSFFTVLYTYIETLLEQKKISAIILLRFIQSYNNDHADTTFIWDETSISTEQGQQELRDFIDRVQSEPKGATKSYFCFVELINYRMQYDYYISIGQNEHVDNDLLYTEMADIFERNTDNNNKAITRSIYQLYLEVLHQQITHWLNTLLAIPSELSVDKTTTGSQSFNGKTGLPPVTTVITDQFKIHEHNLISYCGKEIPLEPQVRKVVARIMERSKTNSYTPISLIETEVLDQRRDYDEKYVSKIVSEARRIFRQATGSQHDYFPAKSGVGYIFSSE